MDNGRPEQDISEVCDLGELGRRLQAARLAAGLSLTGLAAKVGVTKGYLSRLERGKAKPSASMIERIAATVTADSAPLRILAGHIPQEVRRILYRHPIQAPAVLREAFAPYGGATRAAAELPGTHPKMGESAEHLVRTMATKGLYEVVHDDCIEWLGKRAPNSVHAVVTDPPYGLKEYTDSEKAKLRNGKGGVWRIPPALGGCQRRPLPRFTILTDQERTELREFFLRWAGLVMKALVPGGHVFIATNPLVSHLVYVSMIEVGFEKRGEVARLVQTLRGGDRPKNAHEEFDLVTVMPRSCWEPWGVFRKQCEGRVQDNLRKWRTGGLRRVSADQPFADVIKSAPTRGVERDIAPHPSLKPQAFMRQIVRAALPLGEGVVLDPFMGAGSTVAAACAVGYSSIGIESDLDFYTMAVQAIPKLAEIACNGNGGSYNLNGKQGILLDS